MTQQDYSYATVRLTMKDDQTVTIFDASGKYAKSQRADWIRGKSFEIRFWGTVRYNDNPKLYSRGPNAWSFESADVQAYEYDLQESKIY